MKRIVIALGGNALQEAGKPATAESQLEVVEKTSEYIADIIESGYDVVLAHGNGPQVGRIVLQNEYASAVTPAMPFDVCGAMSQGYIGYHMQQGLEKVLRARKNGKRVVTVVTQVVVDKDDPKFKAPSKPIGPFYTEDEARKLSTSIILKTKSSRPDIAMSFARSELEGDIASGEAEKLATSYKRLLNVFKSDAAMSATGITIPIINALLKKGKIDETDEIMKITRQTLKTSRDSTLAQLLDNIDRQLSVIKSKIKAAK